MPFLHYGSDLRIELDAASAKQIVDAIGAHATRGGWVTVTDVESREWHLLVSAGIPIWIDATE